MPRLSRKGLVAASISALVLAPSVARAQTTTTTTTTTGVASPCTAAVTTPTVSVSLQQVPERFVNGVDVGQSTRPVALNPNGVNYSDCIEDMVLQFRMTACGFTGQNLQIWASKSSDCTTPMDRGTQGGISQCWPVSQGSTGLVQSQGGVNYNVRVRDIVGPQNDSPSPTTFTSQGSSACTAQPSFLAVPININFVPVDASGNYAGQAFQYALKTDLVGPPAPTGVKIKDGDTLFVVNWTPNIDTDTGGYDVVIDPIPGQEPGDATVSSSGVPPAQTVRSCPADSGMSTVSTDATVDLGGAGAASDGEASDAVASDAVASDGSPATPDAAAAAAPPTTSPVDDAGCYLKTVGGSVPTDGGNGGMCFDSLLSGGTLIGTGSPDAAAVPVVEAFDDAGNVIDSGTTVTSTATGGIWVPPAMHIINPNPTLGITSTGETNSTYTITGLTNAVPYSVVVASVDNFGNVGPPSIQQCATPMPVNDFWKIYRTDGGQAGGGFCALEAVGAPASTSVAFAGAGALVIAGLRRRRRTRRR
jgi:hypothetical protein